ncbi:MAG TPA: hypothetical protein VD902_14880 [Symbiobacteriaceae bacterium]|nr:hypothetical protein [Symbiobacteriaceae bacterium]
MNELLREDLRTLLRQAPGPCVSIYFPTRRDHDGAHQNAIRLKNLLRMAEGRLLDWGYKEGDARKLLEPAWQLVQERPFWQHQQNGLAVFISKAVYYHIRTPVTLSEMVNVGETFYLRPLLPLVFDEREFYVLGLCLKGPRLFHGSPFDLTEVEVPGMPGGLTEALQRDIQGRQMFRSGTHRGGGHIGSGAEERDAKDEVMQYFRLIDQRVHDLIGKLRAPLVLAGVSYLVPIYREMTMYPYVMAEAIHGSASDLSASNLHQRAWSIAQPYFDEAKQEAVALYRELAGTGRTADDVSTVLLAASHGRVESLLVDYARRVWGTFDPDSEAVTVHDAPQPGDEDLVELAILQTYATGGKVIAFQGIDLPAASALGAVLRY